MLEAPKYDQDTIGVKTDVDKWNKEQYNKLIEVQKRAKKNEGHPFVSSGAAKVFSERAENRVEPTWNRKNKRNINNL